MFRSQAGKRLFGRVAACLALAVLGAIAVVAPDTPRYRILAGARLSGGVFSGPLAGPAECLATGAAKDRSFSPPRQCLPRMAVPAGFFASRPGALRGEAGFVARSPAHDKKSAILLKLRI